MFAEEGYVVLSKEYTSSKQKIKYICPNGHKHSMRLDHWRRGIRCPYCSGKFKKSIEYIKPFIESEDYSLLSKQYKNANTKLTIKCPKGHIYRTSWHNWQSGGHRCPVCNGGVKKDVLEVNTVFENEGYQVVGEFINANTPINVVCPNGHEYYVSISNFESKGSICPKCSGVGVSAGEMQIRSFLDKLYIDYTANDRNIITPYELDIFIPSKKVAIEYCGLYWHSELNYKDKRYHINKLNMCLDKNIKLITIFEDEFLYKKDLVFSRLSSLLNTNMFNKIYARKCIIKEIGAKEAKIFCEKNHLQGYGGVAKIKLGAFYNNMLVAVMTFAKESSAKGIKNSEKFIWKLHRFCSLSCYSVVGIASKFLKYFENKFTWSYIFSFSDRRWSVGNLYENLGFDFESLTEPIYWYIKGKRRIHRFSLRKNKEDIQELTEWENRKLQGYDRIWDCGNLKYVKKNN